MKEINFGELVFLFPVYIWDDVLKKLVIELSFGCPVERVRLRRDKYVFFHSIFFDINIMKIYINYPNTIRVSDSELCQTIYKVLKCYYINNFYNTITET